MLLHRCYSYLTDGPAEHLHLMTGIRREQCFVMTDMVTLDGVDRGITRAFAEAPDVGKALRILDSFGAMCLGVFHSHPGTGIASTSPSPTDLRNQQTWERAYPIVGAIFARGGHIRFFKSSLPLQVEVHGKRVRKIDENLFKLELD